VLSALSYPYVFLQVCAALRREDPALEEASRSLGRGPWATFFRVTLPQLRPAISAGGILVALYVLSEFGAVSMLRYDTLTPVMYVRYTTAFDRGSAAVLGLPLIALAIAIVLIDGMTRGGARYHARAQRREPKRLALGQWRWAALALCVLAAGIGAGVPVIVVCYWLIRGLGRTTTFGVPLSAVLHTVQVAAGGAILAGLATLPLAWLSVRQHGRLGRVLERLAYAGQALPAITIALALVFFSARYLSPIYQTVLVLVFAYGVRFLPEALGATRTALLQVNPNGEEAARSLGAGAVRTFLRVTAPQMLPGFSAGMLLVFLTAVKELPMTLLLSPAGYDTFATTIWTATSEALFGRAALPSLVLLLLSGIAVLVMVRRERQAA
jgi:iron(III) transport system permease protein